MRYSMIVEVPETADVLLLPEDVQYELSELSLQFPSTPMSGTVPLLGKKLVYCLIDTLVDPGDVTLLVDGLIAIYDLDWITGCIQELHYTYIFNEETQVTTREVVNILPFSTTLIYPYLPARLDENEVEIPKDPSWCITYQGTAEFEL